MKPIFLLIKHSKSCIFGLYVSLWVTIGQIQLSCIFNGLMDTSMSHLLSPIVQLFKASLVKVLEFWSWSGVGGNLAYCWFIIHKAYIVTQMQLYYSIYQGAATTYDERGIIDFHGFHIARTTLENCFLSSFCVLCMHCVQILPWLISFWSSFQMINRFIAELAFKAKDWLK